MCTVTVIPLPDDAGSGAFRLVSSRDEQRTRGTAAAPQLQTAGRRSAAWPRDVDAGGTWVGVNDAGLALSLLNFNPPADAPAPPPNAGRSRGAIIPQLLAGESVAEALATLADLDPAGQRPFRLVLTDRRAYALVRGDGRTVEVMEHRTDRAERMVTSSGLGDHVVEGPRRDLWEATVEGLRGEDLVVAQDRYHRQYDPDAGHVAVSMSRRDAWTMSRTEVTVTASGVVLRHAAGLPHETPWPEPVLTVPAAIRNAG